MIDTLALLIPYLAAVQLAMMQPDYAWPSGRAWAAPIKYTLNDATLFANQPACCRYLTDPQSGLIIRVNDTVYLLKH